MKNLVFSLIVLCAFLATPIWAAELCHPSDSLVDYSTATSRGNDIPIQCDSNGRIKTTSSGGTVTPAPYSATGKYHNATVTTSSAPLSAAATRVYLDIVNQDSSATLTCNAGSAAVVGGAGSIDIPPKWHRSWEGVFVPADAINCISSSGTINVTYASY